MLIAIAQTTTWGWGSAKTVGLLAVGLAFAVAWIVVEVRSAEPLVDMTMMRIRGVWTTNLSAFLLGAGMYASFIVFPQFAQLPKSTGFGFGASAVVSSLYLLPRAHWRWDCSEPGRAGSPIATDPSPRSIAGTAISASRVRAGRARPRHPYQMLITSALLGIGIGLAFAALGNLIVQAVPPTRRAWRAA